MLGMIERKAIIKIQNKQVRCTLLQLCNRKAKTINNNKIKKQTQK